LVVVSGTLGDECLNERATELARERPVRVWRPEALALLDAFDVIQLECCVQVWVVRR
jgi:hypothetical protein